MQDTKKASEIIIFFKSGRKLGVQKTITNNYIQLVNWLLSSDDIPFKVSCKDDVENKDVKDFILYKNSIEYIEIIN